MLYAYYIFNRHAGTPTKTKTKDTMSLGTGHICYIGSGIGWMSALLYSNIISHQANYRLIDKAGDEVLFSDNYQVNLTATW